MADPKGVFNCYFSISLVLTLGVKNQDLVVGENVAARVYAILEIEIHPIYIKKCKYHYIKYEVVKEKNK